MGRKIFISHASEQHQQSFRLAQALKAQHCDVWIDWLDLKAGDHLNNSIVAGIHESDIVLICLSPTALNSEWVINLEYAESLKTGKRIVPVLFKKCLVPDFLMPYLSVDLSEESAWSTGIERLLKLLEEAEPNDKNRETISLVDWNAALRSAGVTPSEEFYEQYCKRSNHLENLKQLYDLLDYFRKNSENSSDSEIRFKRFFLHYPFDYLRRYDEWVNFAKVKNLNIIEDEHNFAFKMTPLKPESLIQRFRSYSFHYDDIDIAWTWAVISEAGGLGTL